MTEVYIYLFISLLKQEKRLISLAVSFQLVQTCAAGRTAQLPAKPNRCATTKTRPIRNLAWSWLVKGTDGRISRYSSGCWAVLSENITFTQHYVCSLTVYRKYQFFCFRGAVIGKLIDKYSRGTTAFLKFPKVNFGARKSSSLVPLLSRINPLHIFSYLLYLKQGCS